MGEDSEELEAFDVEFPENNRKGNWKKIAAIVGMVMVAVIVIIIVVAVVATKRTASRPAGESSKSTTQQDGCESFSRPVLFLLNIDGFRPDYLQRGFSPTINKLAKTGVRSKGMICEIPTVTFPNLYSIYTGLYPASHGIVSNAFMNEKRTMTASYYKNFEKEECWHGEPIWLTAKKQNVKTAVYDYLATETSKEKQPDYMVPYNISGRTKFETKVDKGLEWLDKEASLRPYFISLYFGSPDSEGHRYGPDSPQVNQGVKKVDNAIARLLDGIQKRNLTSCTNFLLVSDHGMAKIPCSKALYLEQFISTKDVTITSHSSLVLLYTKNKGHTDILMKNLTCKSNKFRAYAKDSIYVPKRFHYSNNRRIADIILLPDPGWTIYNEKTGYCPKALLGHHGYDNIEPVMSTLFIANGPSFKSGIIADQFLNIEVYNLMAEILKLKPSPNNGTFGSLSYLLRKPLQQKGKRNSNADKNAFSTSECIFPKDISSAMNSCTACTCPYCDNDIKLNLTEFRKNLDLSSAEIKQSLETHLPWGMPKGGAGKKGCILTQEHYVTGYSRYLHIPLWVAYRLTSKQLIVNVPRKNCFRRDIRLSNADTSLCEDYSGSGFDRGHLAPNGDFNFNRFAEQDTLVLSNIAPQSKYFNRDPGLWFKAEELFRKWAMKYSPTFVISGSIFDANGDGFRDSDDKTKRWLKGKYNSVAIPTHFYKIIVRCNTTAKPRYQIKGCPGVLDSLSFVFPHNEQPQCQLQDWLKELLVYTSSINDIEKLTGSELFPDLPYPFSAEFKSRLPTKLWTF